MGLDGSASIIDFTWFQLAMIAGFALASTAILYVVGDGDEETSLWPD